MLNDVLNTLAILWTRHLWIVFCILLCAGWFPLASASSEMGTAHLSEMPLYRCPYTSSPDAAQHDNFVERLNGTRILFIGDSVTRMQYLTLASYLANGLCPDKESESRELEYSLLFSVKDSDYIYRESSRVLNTPRSVESCFCIEGESEPESRSFTFEDEKRSRIQLEYMSYTDEKMRPMRFYLQTALNMRPTHVVMNFGLWMVDTDASCGDKDRDGQPCPYLPKVCSFLTEEQPFHVIWQTSTPKLKSNTAEMSHIDEGHHLHIPARCKLNSTSVLNRVELLHALEPDQQQRFNLFQDDIHLTPEAYHAFNGRLLDMITVLAEGHGHALEDPAETTHTETSPTETSPTETSEDSAEDQVEPSGEQAAPAE